VGAAALLVVGPLSAKELQRWADLLVDSRPLARATAARLATVRGVAPLAPTLMLALEKETDALAVREMIRALGVLSPGVADDALFAAARRFEGGLDADLARALGLRGPGALALAPRLAALDPAGGWWSYFAWATRNGTASVAEAAAAALSTGQSEPWRHLLALARDVEVHLPDEPLARSLEGADAVVRRATLWHLLAAGHPRPAGGSPLARAHSAAPEARGEGSPASLLAFELLGRAWGQPARDSTAAIGSITPGEARAIPATRRVRDVLRESERKALAKVLFGEGKERWTDDEDGRARLDRRSPPESVRTAEGCAGSRKK
jgi:hypothetical protein